MKILILVFALSYNLVWSQNCTVILRGSITNNTAKEIEIKTSSNVVLKTLPIKNNKVNEILNLPSGLYRMAIGQEYTDIYLTDGDLKFTIDLKNFDESIQFTGSLAHENNYLAYKLLSTEVFKGEKRMFFDKEVNVFLDSLTLRFKILEIKLTDGKMGKNFTKEQTKLNNIERWNTLMMYASYHPYLTKKDNFKLSDDYYKFLTEINVNDNESVTNREYISLLGEYFEYWVSKKLTKDEMSDMDRSTLVKLELMRTQITVSEIRDEMVKNDYKYLVSKSEKLRELKNGFIETASNEELKKEIETFASKLENLKIGNPAPAFSLLNYLGKYTSLNDYKGKYVYLDVWATWCGPCKKELPHYEEVKKLYKGKNIEFVSICVWDEKAVWQKFLKDKSIGGEQLFNDPSANEFTDNYMIQAVPTFVLIDKNGNLISRDAPPPSEEALKTKLDSLLK